MNVNFGGQKGLQNYPAHIRRNWRVLDISPKADIVWDMNSHEPIPLSDETVHNYYTSHTLEHARLENLMFIFAELYKTLVPGGHIRIVVPDIVIGIEVYQGNRNIKAQRLPTVTYTLHPPTKLGALIAFFYSPDRKSASGHHMCFDYDTLYYYLKNAGFWYIARKAYNRCSHVFDGMDIERYQLASLYVEAQK